jgi:hypothetical protein
VGGISAQTTVEALRGHFAKSGRIIDAVVMQKNGRPRGFGFITFDAPVPAAAALQGQHWIDGRHVDVKQAVPGERTQGVWSTGGGAHRERGSNKIFVGGLPQDISADELKAYFCGYGPVADAVVMVDRRTSRSRGFGFVRFSAGMGGSSAAEAVLMDFASHRLGGKWVEVKRATPAAILSAAQDGSPSILSELPSDCSPCGCDGGFQSSVFPAGCQDLLLEDRSATSSVSMPISSSTDAGGTGPPYVRGRRGRRRRHRALQRHAGIFLDDEDEDEDDFEEDEDDDSELCAYSSAAALQRGAAADASRLGTRFTSLASTPSDVDSCCTVSAAATDAVESRRHLTPFGGSGGLSENDPSIANLGVVTLSGECTELPMKAMQDGFTREDFLSIEVRPWLSAC